MPFVKKKKRKGDPDYVCGKSRRVGYHRPELDDRGNKKALVKLLGMHCNFFVSIPPLTHTLINII